MSRWRNRTPRWPWRDFLTDEEVATLKAADNAKAEWRRLNAARATIVNRAIKRAECAARASGEQGQS